MRALRIAVLFRFCERLATDNGLCAFNAGLCTRASWTVGTRL